VTTYFEHERLIITQHQARSLTKIALRDAGVPAAEAANVADALVDTSLRGIDTHGLRLLPQYLDELETGVANASARIRVIRDRGAGLLIDADGAVGVRAGQYGVAAVGVRNSNNFGAASVYTRQLARAGLIGIAVTTAASRVALHGDVEPLFVTGPISVATEEFALDMAGTPLDWQLLVLAVDPHAFAGQREFTAGLAESLSIVRAAAPASSSQPDLAPGDPQRAHQRERRVRGIPLDARAADVLSALATRIGVPLRGAADDTEDEIAS
jgi:LDH2 family malate/lactate/ureidoglycolate dehydrogenase